VVDGGAGLREELTPARSDSSETHEREENRIGYMARRTTTKRRMSEREWVEKRKENEGERDR
jgi:hypothetical protein